MSRTTSASVQVILQNDYRAGDDLSGVIATANALTTRVATCAAAKGEDLSDVELELVERWLAAHYYAVSNRPYKAKRTADSSATFDGATGMGLNSTLYGQAALDMDASGCLAAITSRANVGVVWLGKPPGEQLRVDQRD